MGLEDLREGYDELVLHQERARTFQENIMRLVRAVDGYSVIMLLGSSAETPSFHVENSSVEMRFKFSGESTYAEHVKIRVSSGIADYRQETWRRLEEIMGMKLQMEVPQATA